MELSVETKYHYHYRLGFHSEPNLNFNVKTRHKMAATLIIRWLTQHKINILSYLDTFCLKTWIQTPIFFYLL